MNEYLSRRSFIKVSALGGMALMVAGQTGRAAGMLPQRPNVVVILSDEFNFPCLGTYGGHSFSPHLDRLASEGARLDQAYCVAPVCTASRFSVLTGQYPGRCTHPKFLETQPVTDIAIIAWNTYVHEPTITAARWLSRHGYFTAMSGKWHVGGAGRWLNLPEPAADADPSDPAVSAQLAARQAHMIEAVKTKGGFDFAASVLFDNYPEEPVQRLRHHNNEWLANGALQCFEAAKASGKPFFLYLTPTQIHGPSMVEVFDLNPHLTVGGMMKDLPPGYPSRMNQKERWAKADPSLNKENVAGMIMLDDYVGVVLNKLEEMGVADNTLIIFAADHNNEPGKGTCYDSGLHTPAMMRWPGRIPAGLTSQAAVQYTDFVPTIYAACGVPPPADFPLDGTNCLPALLSGHPSVSEREMYFEFGTHRAIRAGNFKYIMAHYPAWALEQMESGKTDVALDLNCLPGQVHASIAMRYYPHMFDQEQLYDLAADPYEQHNLAGLPEYADEVADLKARLAKKLAGFQHPYPLEDQPFLRSETFRKLIEERKAQGVSATWWKDIPWPPVKQ